MAATGIALPFVANPSGGIQLLSGDAYIRQLLMASFGECDSDNPFQDGLGMGSWMIFANMSSMAVRSVIQQRIKKIGDDFEARELARFIKLSFRIDAEAGELFADITFTSLETGAEIPLSKRFAL